MGIPPGPVYILKLIPRIGLLVGGVAGAINYTGQQLGLSIPAWVTVPVAILALPAFRLAYHYYCNFMDDRNARKLGAVRPPALKESSRAIISKLMDSIVNGYPADVVLDWITEYGPAYRSELPWLGSRVIVTTEPHHVKGILATQFESFEKGPVFRFQMNSLLGQGIFNADGDMWKFHRAITRPFFTRERISDFDIYDKNADRSLQLARARLAEGYPIEFQDVVSRFTLDSATEFLFGQTVDSLSAGIPYPPSSKHKNNASYLEHPSNRFAEAFTTGQMQSNIRSPFGKDWPLIEFWGDKVAPFRKRMDEFIEPVMNEALRRREETLMKGGEEKEEEELTLLAHLVNHTQDPTILKDELVNLLVAGRDTTMCLLTFCVYVLTQHPEIEAHLREEIVDKVGAHQRPTYEAMRDMKYVRAFLNEVLRLYPPVPFDTRTSTNSPVLLASKDASEPPTYISANTGCVYTVLLMHRREDLWGPDALKFDPDRFLDERLHKYLTPNPFIFCPFNAGPRICLGQQFAYHEATFYLVRLLQQFTNFRLDDKENVKPPASWKTAGGLKAQEKIVPSVHLTMFVKGGLWVHMDELQSDA
ncbi:cytochrome P450 monooxygenase pc-1 [Panaeolus papilionaceus]|nr:cytochrome P450 monooxygenase pc-1 [Panaeolus papilionaceus]